MSGVSELRFEAHQQKCFGRFLLRIAGDMMEEEQDALTEEPNRSLEERSTGRMGRKKPHSIAHPTQPSSPQHAGSSVQL